MFKSSFAQDLLQESRHHNDLQEEILPRDRHTLYKSQFAASTHGPLDNISLSLEDDISLPPVRQNSKFGNISVSSETTTEPACAELQTSDLGTSDFSSSEIWPGPASNSSSPFEYSPRYRGSSFNGGPSQPAHHSFLNLQSSMQFSYLKRACRELDLGLTEDDWDSIASNLLKDFNKNVRNVAITSLENFVILGDFLSELQSHREEKKSSKDDNSKFSSPSGTISEEDLTSHLSSKALTAKLAAKELETLQVRLECQQLYNDNVKLREEFKQLKQMANPKKYLELQKEIEHLHWQLNKMENSRKLYELATGQLVSFLEQVSSSLSSSPGLGSQNTLTDLGGLSSENLMQAKRLSLASLDMARSQSMPGLADSLHLLTLPKPRRMSAREKRVRRSSSVSKTRVSSASPLPSLAEAEDGAMMGPSLSYQRSSSLSDPLCVSTPKSLKASRVKVEVETGSKRGTLTSVTSISSGSSSTASPASSSERSGTEVSSSESERRQEASLLPEPKLVPVMNQLAEVPGEKKVVMANRAGRLLRTVKLLLAREKSYDLCSAEGRGGGRRLSKCSSSTRSREPSNNSLDSGPVLKTDIRQDQERLRRKLENLELELKAAELVSRNSVSQLDNFNDTNNDDVLKNNETRREKTLRKRTSPKREAPQPPDQRVEEEEDNCVMCVMEREDIRQRLASRPEAHAKLSAVSKVQRSKSDAQDKDIEGVKSKNSSLSSRLIKRSMSFNRIFSSSVLSRSKQYRL